MSMNTGQARVVDPILTTHAQGYQNKSRVGHILFPRVEVLVRGGQVIEFGKESFYSVDARRAPGASTKSLQFGYLGKPFSLVQDALNGLVPREHLQDAQQVPGIDLGGRAVSGVMNILTLNLEVEQAKLATDPATYAPSHTAVLGNGDRWDDNAGNPLTMIEDAKSTIRRTSGVEPNVMVISKPIFNKLKNHPAITERYKYTSSDSITADMIAKLMELEKLGVGAASVLDSNADENAPFTDVWGNVAVLAYVPQASGGITAGAEQPSFGYTYTLKGNPHVEVPSWDNDRKSWVYGVTYERTPVLTGIASGYIFRNVIDATR